MAINLLSGRDEPGTPVEENYALVGKLINLYEGKFGSTNCKVLTGVDLGTEEGQAKFRENNQIVNCLNYVEEVTQMVLSLAEIDG
jgi:hypothetical protein